MTVSDEMFYISSAGRQLFATWQPTEGAARAAALFCHPFGEEKKSAHRTFVETARALADRGVASLRFDFSGCGDSEGEFHDASLQRWTNDTVAAWEELTRRARNIPLALVGLRIGASVAAISCARLKNVSAIALWQPIVDGKAEFAGELRRLLIQQMMTTGKAGKRREDIIADFERGKGDIELDGYPVNSTLYNDICSLRLSRERTHFPTSCGVVQFARSNRRLEDFIRATGLTSVVMDVPPIWLRTDFVPTAQTGTLLATDGVLRWMGLT